jgi:hypothetical protein
VSIAAPHAASKADRLGYPARAKSMCSVGVSIHRIDLQ